MSDYNKATNFTAKDTLPSGNANKIVKGTEIDAEFTAISSAIASKANSNSPALTGTPTTPTATAGSNTTQIASTAFVKTAVDNLSLGTMSTQNANAVAVTGGTITGITDLAVADGGTGQSSYTNGQLLIGNASGGLSKATLTAGSNVTITNGDGTITIAASGGGGGGSGVTSVATGNGLAGGTITSTGTLTLGPVASNSIGSYCTVYGVCSGGGQSFTYGSDYAGNTSGGLFQTALVVKYDGTVNYQGGTSGPISGTWRWMSGSYSGLSGDVVYGIAVRVA